jgi:WD repeat-containing protein 55
MDIPVGSQIFDLCFAPKQQVVFTAALNGEIKAFEYDDDGQHQHKFTLRPNKKSCRGLAISAEELYAVGKAKSLMSVLLRRSSVLIH